MNCHRGFRFLSALRRTGHRSEHRLPAIARERPLRGRLFAVALPVLACCVIAGCGVTLDKNGQFSSVSGSSPEMALASSSDTKADKDDKADKKDGATTGSIKLDAKATKTAVKLTDVSNPKSTAYKIGPLDVLEISVFKVPELSRTVQVASSGTINLPLVGEVPAAGRTARDIEHDLTKRLGTKYLQSPQVNVFVKEYNSQRVTVDGSVKKPGVYPIRGDATLLQMIATAEGLTDTAKSEVVIFRTVDGKRSAAKFDLDEIRAGKSKDPQIVEGDLIVVDDSTMKSAWQNLIKAIPLSTLFVTLL
jgi:polysaccharide export outer membrane protein